jgi:hypothetical protein
MLTASEVQLNLDLTFETQGTVKPGAILQEIISPPRCTTTKLRKNDVIVVWGGSRDIGRN